MSDSECEGARSGSVRAIQVGETVTVEGAWIPFPSHRFAVLGRE
ncbi:MAG TPA: hypothetical protein VN175_07005 [Rhizomicrobium sp.]|nr:hypothetical protein [Rhizomicrobium sp.]